MTEFLFAPNFRTFLAQPEFWDGFDEITPMPEERAIEAAEENDNG